MHALFLASLTLLPMLAACDREASGAFAAANAASVFVFGRDIPDLAISAASGRDCSVVHFDQGKPYCRPQEPPPETPVYCTHSLGVVDCWVNPQALPGPPPEVADGPRTLTPAQDANRTHRWPDL
jgi:hypothetical protein